MAELIQPFRLIVCHMKPDTSPTPQTLMASLWQQAGGALLVSSGLIGILVLAPSWYMLEVYDRVVNSRNVVTLGMLTLGMLLLIGLLELIEWHRAELLRGVAQAIDQGLAERIGQRAFERVRRQGAAAGQQALGALQSVRGFVLSPALTGLLDVPVALLFLVLLWQVHPALSALALGVAGLQLLSVWWLERRNAPVQQQGSRFAGAAQSAAQHAFDQAATWQALDMRETLGMRWLQLQQQAGVQFSQLAQRRAGHQALSRWLQQLVGSALLGLACWLLLQQTLSGGAGMLIVASLLGGRVVAPLVQVVTHGTALVQAIEAWKSLRSMLPDDAAGPRGLALPPPSGQLSVEQLVVLPAGPGGGQPAPLLRGLNFRLAPGEMLVVLGHSGAGKSTLAKALTGQLTAAAGSVRLDGADVAAWPLDELGPHLGYLPQQVALLDGSIADNVCRFGEVDRTRLEQALNDAGLLPFVQSLPEGLDTAIGEGGAWLSGGWRQRIGLARALYGRPAFLVLDEPNASLDRVGDGALEQVLREFKARDCTVVVMTHRAGLVRLADRLLVLRDGQQLAFGPRDEVLAALRGAGAQKSAPAPQALVPAALAEVAT